MNENEKYVKSIAEELEKIYNGEAYHIEGSNEYFSEYEEIENDDFSWSYKILDGYLEGEVVEDEPVQVGFYDYFENVLDIEYTIGSDKEFRGVRLMVAYGGPNVYINTNTQQVELYWWNERATAYIDSDICEAINATFEELYNCL